MKRKRKQCDPRQRMLPLPLPPRKQFPKWEPPLVSEPPPSKPYKQGVLFWRICGNPDYFYWPSTDATPGNGRIDPPDWPETGPLRRFGYAVGVSGKPRSTRQTILTRFFELKAIPNLASPDEVLEWGDACSAARLKKMAYSIATFCRNAKRKRRALMRRAIENWEDDLAWLKKKYYDGCFDQKFNCWKI
jgi:hypothetical protein